MASPGQNQLLRRRRQKRAGEVRIEFDGKIYSGPFSISAHHGNKSCAGRSQREFLTTIDIPKILKLPELPRNSAYSSRP
jgi:hypothetical protein